MKRWELELAYHERGQEIESLKGQLAERDLEIGRLRKRVEDQEAVIAAQGVAIAELKAMVEELRRAGHRQAGRFARDADRLTKDPKKPGRKPGQGTWSRRGEPSEEQKAKAVVKTSHLEACPDCGGELADMLAHTHYEWDIPPVEPILTCFESQSGYCDKCQRRQRSRHPDQISEATGAAGVVIGPHAKALASDMKHHLGLSYAKISAFFAVAFGMTFTRGGLYRADMRLAARAGPVYRELIELVRQLAQVHVDETGWRIGTLSAWLWVFCGREVTVYTIRKSRGHEVVIDILGRTFRGILTTDGLMTYDAAALADWLKQKCLAHILRHLKALAASDSTAHRVLGTEMTSVLKDALALGRQRCQLAAADYAAAAAHIEQRLDKLIADYPVDGDDDGARMVRHLTKHRDHLLRFLYVAGVEPTNNDAERGLRPGVITRKVGPCNRTEQGADAHSVLASIGATCRKQGIPVIDFLIRLQRATDDLPSIVSATPAASPAER